MQTEPAKFRELSMTAATKRKLQVAVPLGRAEAEIQTALKKRKVTELAADPVSCMSAGGDSPVTPVLEEGARAVGPFSGSLSPSQGSGGLEGPPGGSSSPLPAQAGVAPAVKEAGSPPAAKVHNILFTHTRLPCHMSAHTHESAQYNNTAHMQDHHHHCLPP